MQRSLQVAVAMGVLAVAGLAWAFWPTDEEIPATGRAVSEESGGVTATATDLGDGRVRLVLDTHTVDLSDFDAFRDVRLQAGGAVVAPASAIVGNATPHHVDVTLAFDARPAAFEVVVRDVGGVAERRLAFA